MQQLKVNTSLQGGQYYIEQVLGQGSFGITYRGYDTMREERVAIKEFFMKGVTERDETDNSVSVSDISNYATFREQKEKFRKEAKRLSTLSNSHIVRVHNQFEENGTAYYVMDYVDGENLRERMNRTGQPLTEDEVWNILPQVLDALKTVHDAGLWHLDLKPGNIMIDKYGYVKLIDFGASKQIDPHRGGATAHTTISFTPGYAPREQMDQRYEKFGPWTDIYALGATLYALLTCKRPPLPSDIDDDSSADKHTALALPSYISERMRNLVVRMMSTNRKYRPQSVDEVMPDFSNHSEETAYEQEEDEGTQFAQSAQDYEGTEFSQSANSHEETEYSQSSSRREETEFSQAYSQNESEYSNQNHNQEYIQQQTDKKNVNSLTLVLIFIGILISIVFIVNIRKDDDKKIIYNEYLGYGTYEGALKAGEPDGYGTITYDNGVSFTGVFRNGLAHGHGTLTSSTGEILYDGLYEYGVRKEVNTQSSMSTVQEEPIKEEIVYPTNLDGNVRLYGAIVNGDERYPISMFLNIEGNDIRGFYYYDKYHNNIKLSGHKEDGENIYVFEYDYDEEGDEYDGCEFTGKYYNGKFSGIFHRTDGQQWYFELMLEL